MGRGGWPSGRILVHFRAFEPKPRCRGTRATFGLHAVLATCPVFAFGARNPLFLGLKLAVGISVALQFGPFCHQLLHADGGDARSRGAQFRSGSPMGCNWHLMRARGGSRSSCCRVLACFPELMNIDALRGGVAPYLFEFECLLAWRFLRRTVAMFPHTFVRKPAEKGSLAKSWRRPIA